MAGRLLMPSNALDMHVIDDRKLRLVHAFAAAKRNCRRGAQPERPGPSFDKLTDRIIVLAEA